MKYAVLICSGMSDRPIPYYNNVTPLSSANKPYMDNLAKNSEIGLTKTGDITELPIIEKANLSLFGYDPKKFFKGSSLFYSASMGIIPNNDVIIFRCSLVTLSDEENYEEKIMLSDNADSISQSEFDKIFDLISKNIGNDIFEFVKGNDKNIFLLWKKGEPYAGEFTPPFMALSQCIGEYLPKGDFVQPIYDIMQKSNFLLRESKVNALWVWGEGINPDFESFEDKFGLKSTIISDTDFINGIGKLTGMKICESMKNISDTALQEFKNGQDIVFIYVNFVLQYGLDGNFDGKKKAIEKFDKNIVAALTDGLCKSGEDFGIMIVSDLAVPVYLKRYSSEPVPYLIYKSNIKENSSISKFDENTAADSENYILKPYELINRLILQP